MVTHVPQSHLRAQATLAYGSAVAIGLQIGLILCFVEGSWEPLLTVPVMSVFFATAVVILWNSVFPRLQHLPKHRQLLAQAVTTLAAISSVSFAAAEVLGRLRGRPTLMVPYIGGDITVTIPASTIEMAPWVNVLVPIVPCILLTLVGFNQSWRRIFQLERSENEARELVIAARLEALRSRINPHFLFNSLNSIAQLISSDPQRAEECVERLSEIFRYLLKSDARELVRLEEELEIADAYLDIERARFGDRLEVDFDVSDEVLSWPVPVLILQPLVENAVKHGIGQTVAGGRVRIVAGVEGSVLRLEVHDSGAGLSVPAEVALSCGVGLRNVNDRLVHRFGPGFAPVLYGAPGQGTTVVLRLPREGESVSDRAARGLVAVPADRRRSATAVGEAWGPVTAGPTPALTEPTGIVASAGRSLR